MRPFLGFAAGLVFGLGLVISGMADPAKVLNFLDLFGTWDPSLAFVMGGAVVATFLGYRLAWRRSRPVLMQRFELPSSKTIDGKLVAGAAIFGLGWGLGGYCPGPALTALPLLAPGTLVFVPAMLIGMWAGVRTRNTNFFSTSNKGATA
ncbi:DUF6691 family protein [Lutibaculum baratangense]|uniref:YeeE/YedE family protein n=1 Tax=Lutibaculum baratangense AMV1 TaxID=631454 RepID=V4RFI9_9HYPH|nr:DUF6691 family protein [Lutibaculum baratangense]ESR24901.1 hypothetical protein N177_2224 [Lutibaculum baratangense AMV1]